MRLSQLIHQHTNEFSFSDRLSRRLEVEGWRVLTSTLESESGFLEDTSTWRVENWFKASSSKVSQPAKPTTVQADVSFTYRR
jgi:hypothetical protein